MKKPKYLKVFEAFESIKLTKTLKFIKSDKKFISLLESVASNIDMPMSKYSDEYFQYLPFRKALELKYTPDVIKCLATSKDAFPTHYITGSVCQNGMIRRTWGASIRSVSCPICRGTGIKQNSTLVKKWLKFWFNKDGVYINTTVTDSSNSSFSGEKNAYYWNSIYNFKFNKGNTNGDVELLLSDAHFSIVLDYLGLINSNYKYRTNIKNSRIDDRENALYLMKDSDIIKRNINKYLDAVSNKIKISDNLMDFQKTILKFLGGRKIGYYIMFSRNFSELRSLIEKVYKLIEPGNESILDSSTIRQIDYSISTCIKSNYYFNNEISISLSKISFAYNDRYPASLDYDKSLKNINTVLEKIEEVNRVVYEIVSNQKVENIEDLEILERKIKSMFNIWENRHRLGIGNLYYAIKSIRDVSAFIAYMRDIQLSVQTIDKEMEGMDRFIRLIKRV